MKHRQIKKVLAAMLAVMMTASVFTGCDDKDESSSAAETTTTAATSEAETESKAETQTDSQAEPAAEPEKITASAVKFQSAGKYTTKVESKEVDLSGLTADNVEVTYIGFNGDEVLPETLSEDGSAGPYAPGERFTKLDEVKKNDDGTFDITFTDENVAQYGATQYTVRFKDLNESATVNVESEEIKLSAEATPINETTTEAKITLTLDNSEFADEVTEDMLSLGNAFQKMNIESLSSAGKNLTVQLTGSVTVYGEEGAFSFGTVSLDPAAVKDCNEVLTVGIDIQTQYAGFDGATLKFEDGKITGELKSYGAADLDKLTKDNIKIKGVTVEKVEKKDDVTAAVTMSAKDVKDVNGFVKLISGKEADFGGYKTTVDLKEASFYPVFDFCEEDGDNLKITLMLYCFDGTFDKDISAGSISFDGGFKEAKAESVKVTSDTVAELVLTVPAGGQKFDNFSLNGDVILAKGAMVNDWGEKTSEDAKYSRLYSNETMGKAAEGGTIDKLSPKALGQIQEWVRGKETWYGNAFYYGNMAISGYSAVKQVLEFAGIVKSEHQQVMDSLKNIQETLENMQNTLQRISKDTMETKKALYASTVADYEKDLFMLYDALIGYNSVITLAGNALAEQGTVLSEDATPEEALEYQHKIYKYIDEQLAKNPYDGNYCSFNDYYKTILQKFSVIAGENLSESTSNNPLLAYDRMYCNLYNFDTQAYLPRSAQRQIVRARLIEAMTIITARFEMTGTEPVEKWSRDYKKYKNYFDQAMHTIDALEVTGLTADQVSFSKREIEVEASNSEDFVSDIKVYGTSDKTAKAKLEQLGYTVINYDLNRKAGGYYIYLGYKTTKDYSKAIKNLVIRTGKNNNNEKWNNDGVEYTICPYDGDTKFKNEKGALNCDAGGTWMWLYYTKTEQADKKGITSIYANNGKSGSVSNKDLNDSSGGDDIYLHVTKLANAANYIKEVGVFKGDSSKVPSGYDAAVPANLNSGNGGEQIYLAYKMTTTIDDAVKSFVIDSEHKGADAIDVNGIKYTLCKGEGFDGNINAGNAGKAMWLYSTTTQQGGNDGAVADIEIDSIFSEDAVSKMNLNEGAGGDVLYMHGVTLDPKGKRLVKKTVGDDPAYYPFCYALGSKIRVEVRNVYNPQRLKAAGRADWYDWKALGGNPKRNWNNAEIDDFLFRLDGRTLSKDLELAGFNLGDAEMLVTDISPDIGTATYYGLKYWVVEKVKAAYIHKDQSSVTSKSVIDDWERHSTWAYFIVQ
ncbi:hypothetical protein SAMN02910317_02977 [Ruminococcaceae bacterium FB2012]|nr:hypothetical protein SAMN02910317_02977 [Ruminococcaceae bacterium FB2012]